MESWSNQKQIEFVKDTIVHRGPLDLLLARNFCYSSYIKLTSEADQNNVPILQS